MIEKYEREWNAVHDVFDLLALRLHMCEKALAQQCTNTAMFDLCRYNETRAAIWSVTCA
jgi:hypothetical protein